MGGPQPKIGKIGKKSNRGGNGIRFTVNIFDQNIRLIYFSENLTKVNKNLPICFVSFTYVKINFSSGDKWSLSKDASNFAKCA